MRGHCAIRKIQRKRAIRHKHRTAFFVLQSTRGRSMSVCSTQSCERVKGRSPLRSPEAAPLAGVRGSAPRSPSSTRGRSMRARSTQSRNGCREGRRPFAGAGQRPAGVQRQRLWWGLGAKPLGSPFTPKSSQSPLFPRLSAAHAFGPFPRFEESAQGGLRR